MKNEFNHIIDVIFLVLNPTKNLTISSWFGNKLQCVTQYIMIYVRTICWFNVIIFTYNLHMLLCFENEISILKCVFMNYIVLYSSWQLALRFEIYSIFYCLFHRWIQCINHSYFFILFTRHIFSGCHIIEIWYKNSIFQIELQ